MYIYFSVLVIYTVRYKLSITLTFLEMFFVRNYFQIKTYFVRVVPDSLAFDPVAKVLLGTVHTYPYFGGFLMKVV